MRDTIFYKVPKNEQLQRFDNANSICCDNSDFHYNYNSGNIIIINNTGIQTVVFLPEELYPDET